MEEACLVDAAAAELARTDLISSLLGRVSAITVKNMNLRRIHRILPASMLLASLVSVHSRRSRAPHASGRLAAVPGSEPGRQVHRAGSVVPMA